MRGFHCAMRSHHAPRTRHAEIVRRAECAAKGVYSGMMLMYHVPRVCFVLLRSRWIDYCDNRLRGTDEALRVLGLVRVCWSID